MLDIIKQKYNDLSNKIKTEKEKIGIEKGKLDQIKKQIEDEKKHLEEVQEKQELYQETAIFLTSLLEKNQKSLEDVFSKIGSSSIHKIFGEDKNLLFLFDKAKKKNPSVNIKVSQPFDETPGEELITDIMDAEGGAMVDIVSLSLRLAMIELVNPKQTGPIFLDETFKYVAKNESIRSAGDFLRETSDKMNKQMIIITHSPEILPYADKLFILEQGPKKTVIVKEQSFNEKD